jgi:hypothetical protein
VNIKNKNIGLVGLAFITSKPFLFLICCPFSGLSKREKAVFGREKRRERGGEMGKRPRIDKERIHKLKIRPVLTHA